MHPSGDIYLACGIINGCNVAAKLESISSKGQTLEHDFHVLKILSGGMGLPNVQWLGSEGGYNAIVFDCLGPSLEDCSLVPTTRSAGELFPTLQSSW